MDHNEIEQNEAGRAGIARGAFGMLLAVLVLCGICLLIATFAGNDSTPTGKQYLKESIHIWNTGEFPKPEDFLADGAEYMVSSVRYQRCPKDESGTQTVALRLQLEDGTTRVETASLTMELPEMTWEIGTEPNLSEMLGPEYADAELLDTLPMRVYPGDYYVNVRTGGEVIPFLLHARDTTPPTVKFKDPLIFHVGALVLEKHFVESWEDICNDVTFVLSSDVDTSKPGVYPISMTATDSNGNGITYELSYSVIE